MKHSLLTSIIVSGTLLASSTAAQAQSIERIMDSVFNSEHAEFCNDIALGHNQYNNRGSQSQSNQSSRSSQGGGGISVFGIGANGHGGSSRSQAQANSNSWDYSTAILQTGQNCSNVTHDAAGVANMYMRTQADIEMTEMQTNVLRDVEQGRQQRDRSNSLMQMYQLLQR